jgi:hypothetical protein
MEQDRPESPVMDEVIEIIGQAVFDFLPDDVSDDESEEALKSVGKFMDLAVDSFVLVQWPESQEYMEEDWFRNEAVLDSDMQFGSSAYLIPLFRVLEHDLSSN